MLDNKAADSDVGDLLKATCFCCIIDCNLSEAPISPDATALSYEFFADTFPLVADKAFVSLTDICIDVG